MKIYRKDTDEFRFDAKYGQPIVKDGCGVFGVIRKPGSRKIPNQVAVSSIDCIRYRGSELGAGYAAFDSSKLNTCLIKAFVKNSQVGLKIERDLSTLLGKPRSTELTSREFSNQVGNSFKVLALEFEDSFIDLDLEMKVDEINHGLIGDRTVDGRIFSYGKFVNVFKEVGFPFDVASIYGLNNSDVIFADMWLSHTRQPTNSPGSSPIWSHPFCSLDCAIVHNGDISSFGSNLEFLNSIGYKSHVGTDSEVISRLVNYLVRFEGLSVVEAARVLTNPFEERIVNSASTSSAIKYRGAALDGPFSVVIGYADNNDSYLIALTDRSKFRPLIIGEDDYCYFVASEENQIRNISKDARVWTPEPGSFFIASLKRGLIEAGNSRTRNASTQDLTPKRYVQDAIDATGVGFNEINRIIEFSLASGKGCVSFKHLSGQRYIGIGLTPKKFNNPTEKKSSKFKVELMGFPGNCLANLNDGGIFEVFGNVADDLADTMHSGAVIVHGSARDVVAQAIQGGDVFVRGSVGNRAAIQMREYRTLRPTLVIGETADDYLGEYMAGGIVLVLNLSGSDRPVGSFVGTGMVGGAIYLRGTVAGRQIGLQPKRADIMNYLYSCELSGLISGKTMRKIELLEFPSERELENEIPEAIFKRVKFLFFRSKYSRQLSVDYRQLEKGLDDVSLISEKVSDFCRVFDISASQVGSILNSKFTVVRTISIGEEETPIPPQEVPVEE